MIYGKNFIDSLRDVLDDSYAKNSNIYHQSQDPSAPKYIIENRVPNASEMANRGALYFDLGRLGAVSEPDYDNFMNSRDAFSNMMQEWSNEDDFDKRRNIIQRYMNEYGFNDSIHSDLLRGIMQNDAYYNENPITGFEGSYDTVTDFAPYNPFNSRDTRTGWLDWVEKNQKAAAERYNPYRRV